LRPLPRPPPFPSPTLFRSHALAARPLGHALDRALEIAGACRQLSFKLAGDGLDLLADGAHLLRHDGKAGALRADARTLDQRVQRSEEHTSELQSRFDLVCR